MHAVSAGDGDGGGAREGAWGLVCAGRAAEAGVVAAVRGGRRTGRGVWVMLPLLWCDAAVAVTRHISRCHAVCECGGEQVWGRSALTGFGGALEVAASAQVQRLKCLW